MNNPEVTSEFNNVYEMMKKRIKLRVSKNGLDEEHAELISIKVASIETDFYFTDKKKELDEIKKAG